MSSDLVPVPSVLVRGRDEIVVERIGRVAPLLGIVSLACLLSLPWATGPIVVGEHLRAMIGMSLFFVGGLIASIYPFCVSAGTTARVLGACGCGVLVLEAVCAWWLTS